MGVRWGVGGALIFFGVFGMFGWIEGLMGVVGGLHEGDMLGFIERIEKWCWVLLLNSNETRR